MDLSGIKLDIGEAEDFEDHALILDKFQEVLSDHRLRVLLFEVEHRVPVLVRNDMGMVLGIFEIDLILNKYILAEVAW